MTTQEMADELKGIAADISSQMTIQNKHPRVYAQILDAYARALAIVRGTQFEKGHPTLGSDESGGALLMYQFVKAASDNAQVKSLEEDYRRDYSGQSVDIDKASRQTIQSAINALRDGISSADDLAEEHKLRLLNRLEILQSEIHKKLPDFQRMLGTIMEVSVALKNVCENLKPFVEPLKTTWRIVTDALNVINGLPPATSFPALPAALEDEESDG